mmetsp:Transcript_103794/g.332628  ORF Transcript_103794/g.332628 Transcript_103794/m.332628 type:complete len:477 (+) Transcript_103794:1220-2650(+)|eukprot:CAMPEP_0203872738 /NCGR_PEP_ID=MMETSP0359-20131031/19395_1 /ASSEMBLY_ACC=CAM_ASM_000338 /TAXON_ID=268821 /ORGANISM="Scrippsiella Hangoei, Strain SHTV-5" /LENGTH=476 /DNA_ID=CAMNT_0050791429 /DNA_START=112 /DNA_END=1542 /DNA_ORIENTATION=-
MKPLALGTCFLSLVAPGLAAPTPADVAPVAEVHHLDADDACLSSTSPGIDGACSLQALQRRTQRLAGRGGARLGFLEEPHWLGWLQRAAQRSELLNGTISYEECHLKDSQCSLESMKGKPTLVYPGGETSCMNGDDYAFAVNPGDSDKLLIYFEGGGACWQAKGNVVLQCTDSMEKGIATTGLGQGFQNKQNMANPFRSYTVVEPIYCSGDAHMGDRVQEWSDKQFPQKGYANANSAMSWAKTNVNATLSNLVISGFSAGALGTMGWSYHLLGMFPHERASVLVDSYAGIFPDGTEGPTLKDWGACSLPIFSESNQGLCSENQLSTKVALEAAMAAYPKVGFGYIQSKVDGSQIWFYKGLAMSNFMMGAADIEGPDFYNKTLALFEEYTLKFPNYVEILLDGDQHCYTESDLFFSATTANSDGEISNGTLLVQWVTDFLQGNASSACQGALQGADPSHGDDYCDKLLTPKVLNLDR